MIERIRKISDFVRGRTRIEPQVGLILGSGLGAVVDSIDIDTVIPYSELPGAPQSTVVGHSGRLVAGHVGPVPVLVMQGRVHYYEGWSMEDVILLPRTLVHLGARRIIVTNAAGGVNTSFTPGDLMLITDQINMFFDHPLRGINIDEFGVRFPDMSEAYAGWMREEARGAAAEAGLTLREGVYLGCSGPSYETPAEIRAWRTLGADAVGMSTVPETIALRHMDAEVLGISCITNMAAGILAQKLDHSEVMETTARVQREFTRLVLDTIPRIAGREKTSG